MDKKLWNFVLVVFLGIGIGFAFLVGINIAVQAATAPLSAKANQIIQMHQETQRRLVALEQGEQKFNDMMQKFARNLQEPRAVPQQAPQPPAEDLNKVYEIPVGNSAVKGKADAPITIVEFMDFQCPFCARFHPVTSEVINAFPDKVRVIIKNFPLPFHQQAKPAAKAALAAGEQGKYFEMAELILANHQNLSAEKFKELAGQIGLNVEQFNNDLIQKDAQYEQVIADDMALARAVDVRGTPTYFINGRKTWSRDLAGFTTEVKALLDQPAPVVEQVVQAVEAKVAEVAQPAVELVEPIVEPVAAPVVDVVTEQAAPTVVEPAAESAQPVVEPVAESVPLAQAAQ